MQLREYLESTGQSQAAFGRKVGVSQAAVAQWVAGGGIEPERVLGLAAATDWKVTPHEWRPDLYPHPEDGMPRERAAA